MLIRVITDLIGLITIETHGGSPRDQGAMTPHVALGSSPKQLNTRWDAPRRRGAGFTMTLAHQLGMRQLVLGDLLVAAC